MASNGLGLTNLNCCTSNFKPIGLLFVVIRGMSLYQYCFCLCTQSFSLFRDNIAITTSLTRLLKHFALRKLL